MSEHIFKRHNKSLLIYHIVCPSKYRRKIFSEAVESTLKETCKEISKRYEINFIEIGSDEDHVHFLVQSVPIISPKSLVQTINGINPRASSGLKSKTESPRSKLRGILGIKSITGRERFKIHPEAKKILWGGHIWTSGYYVNTVGQYGNEKVIREYVESQGQKYKQIYKGQMNLFD